MNRFATALLASFFACVLVLLGCSSNAERADPAPPAALAPAQPASPAHDPAPVDQSAAATTTVTDQEVAEQAKSTPPRIDPATGATKANFPPPLHFDHLSMTLEIDLGAMDSPTLTGRELLVSRAVGSPRTQMRLDAAGMQIRSIKGQIGQGELAELRFEHTGNQLTIFFDRLGRAVEPGEESTIAIEYTLDFSVHQGVGLTWSPGQTDAESPTDRSPSIHSQGQANWNHTWFPCHDFPNDRLATTLVVTAPSDYRVLSNGALTDLRPASDGQRTTWTWVQARPHPAYLVTLVVGKYAVIDLRAATAVEEAAGAFNMTLDRGELIPAEQAPAATASQRGVPVYGLVPQGAEDKGLTVLADTPAMIDFFEQWFDEPYPWEKYAQVFARDFRWGGMENTSATTLARSSLNGDRESEMDLVSHELAHQWTGDLITCKSWEHLWLNEGWASYAEALWREHHAGVLFDEAHASDAQLSENDRTNQRSAAARAGYFKTISGFMRSQRRSNQGEAPGTPAMVSNIYSHPDDTFEKSDNPYSKGAMLLHMIRMRLGDEAFQNGVREYINRSKFRQVETDEFRRILEEISGQSLERMFTQFAMRPGIPRLKFDFSYADNNTTLTVRVEQLQTINADNPAYALSIPIQLKHQDGPSTWITLDIDQRTATQSFPITQIPSDIVVDPNLTIMSARTVDKPMSMWRRQLGPGNTLPARLEALDAMETLGGVEAFAALCGITEDAASDEFLRDEAREAAGRVLARMFIPATTHLAQR